jgi:hypothetical protein
LLSIPEGHVPNKSPDQSRPPKPPHRDVGLINIFFILNVPRAAKNSLLVPEGETKYVGGAERATSTPAADDLWSINQGLGYQNLVVLLRGDSWSASFAL